MAFSRTWDSAYEAVPANSEQANLGAQRIREVKIDVRERMAVDHVWSGSADDGKHNQVTLKQLASDPVAAAGFGFVYTKDVGGTTELFFRDSAAGTTQLTSGGTLLFDDARHGNRSGGSLHAAATGSAAGFMSAADKTNLDDLVANAQRKLQTVDLDGNQLIIDADGDSYVQASVDDALTWTIGGVARHVFSGQNVGFGTTSLASWGSQVTAVEIGTSAAILSTTNDPAQAIFSSNAYYNGTQWVYKNTEKAARYEQFRGVHQFYVAPSGTAGNAITWTKALQINNDGSVVVSAPPFKLQGANPSFRYLDAGGVRRYEEFFNTGSNYFSRIFYDTDGVTQRSAIDQYANVFIFKGFPSDANTSVFRLQPSDFGPGIPRFDIYKDINTNIWRIRVADNVTSNIGTLAFQAGGYRFDNNGVWIGNPAGGNKGPGSLNAQKLFYQGHDVFYPSKVSEGTWTIAANSYLTVPAGIYVTENTVFVQVYINGIWRDVSGTGGAPLLWSDGSNTRLWNPSSTSSRTVNYVKLSP